ncbi:unnamed protein product [Hermetia illucens]|uniref:Uncharacterized protein n=1 Tax=Hermetia illucens TaxID=343691 RepID=A0A7R8UWV5_HERIL|nr:unnamed protein product [Hermetia illucens]
MSAPEPLRFIKMMSKKRRNSTDSSAFEQQEDSDEGGDTVSKSTLSSDCESEMNADSGETIRSAILVGRKAKRNKTPSKDIRGSAVKNARQEELILEATIASLEVTIN